MADTAGPVSSTQRLDAFLAALSELEKSERAPFLRAFLEYALEIAQANETEYYTYLGECAMLAADNMQDIRLENLELQVQQLVNPPTKPWGEFLTDVALTFALQVGILVSWEFVAGSVIALTGRRALMLARQATEVEVLAARSEQSAIQETLKRLQTEKQELAQISEADKALLSRGGYIVSPQDGGGWLVKPGPLERFKAVSLPEGAFVRVPEGYKLNSYERIAAEIVLGETATRANSARVIKAIETHRAALIDGSIAARKIKDGWSTSWRENIGNEKGGVLISLTQEVLDDLRKIGDGPTAPVDEPFLTSEITGRYLDWVSEQRLGVVQSYANLRLMLRATTDSDLLAGDDFVKYVTLLGTEVLQRWQELQQRSQATRASIAKGFELAFWREYLQANGILVVEPGELGSPDPNLDPGKFTADHLILAKFPDDASTYRSPGAEYPHSGVRPLPELEHYRYRYRTQHYKGASRIPSLLAGALFRRFARPHFANKDKAKSLQPFDYDPAAYSNVPIPPNDNLWGYPDPTAAGRIDEMRFMVIRFFCDLPQDTLDPVVTAALGSLSFVSSVAGAEAAEARDTWLAAQGHGVDVSGQDPVAADLAASQSAESQFSELAQTAAAPPGSPLALQVAQLQFADMLTDLNQDIFAYQLLETGALEIDNTVDKRTPAVLEREILSEREVMKSTYAALLDQAGEQRDRLESLYQPAVDALTQWHPGSVWVWYGPDGTPERTEQ